MRIVRPWRVALAMGVMLVSGGCAALAQERPAPAGSASAAALPARAPRTRAVNPDPWAPRSGPIRLVPPTEPLVGRPLLIVDGEELQHDRGHEIDLEQIESIEILRGAQAIRIYGHRAADGVVLIRMKRR